MLFERKYYLNGPPSTNKGNEPSNLLWWPVFILNFLSGLYKEILLNPKAKSKIYMFVVELYKIPLPRLHTRLMKSESLKVGPSYENMIKHLLRLVIIINTLNLWPFISLVAMVSETMWKMAIKLRTSGIVEELFNWGLISGKGKYTC